MHECVHVWCTCGTVWGGHREASDCFTATNVSITSTLVHDGLRKLQRSAWINHHVSSSPRRGGGQRLPWAGQESNTSTLTAPHHAGRERGRWTDSRRSASMETIRLSEVERRMV